MDQKSRKVISGLPAQDSLPGLCEAFFGAAETLQKRLCNASDTPQKHSRRHPHLHLYVFSHRGEFHDQCARWSTPNARASAPSSFLRPLTPDSAPDFGTCCLKMNKKHHSFQIINAPISEKKKQKNFCMGFSCFSFEIKADPKNSGSRMPETFSC